MIVGTSVEILYEILFLFSIRVVPKINTFLYAFRLNDLFGLVIVVFMHIERFSHEGQVCSGDFLIEGQEFDASEYLIQRGRLFWTLCIAVWAVLGMAILAAMLALVIVKLV